MSVLRKSSTRPDQFAKAKAMLRPATPFMVAALVLIFLWQLIFSGRILARGDTLLYFYPYWSYAAEALRAGRIPLWNPQIFMGAPFVANSQAGFFYPLNWPLWLLLPVPYAVSASIVLHVALAALGSFVLARRQLQLSLAGSFLAAATFSLGGYLTAQVEHVNQLQGLAWLPWLLAVGVGGEERSSPWRTTVQVLVMGLILALQLAAGHTQTLFISVLALLIFRVAKELPAAIDAAQSNARGTVIARTVALTGGVSLASLLVAALLGAIQLLPTLELAQLSGREGGLPLNEAVSFSWHPALIPQSMLPRFGESQFTEYVAYLPLTVMLLALVGAWQWRRSGGALAALIMALGGVFLALGAYNPVYLLLARLPGFNFFRAPARWLVLVSLGAALLAGLGLDFLRGTRGASLLTATRRAIPWAASTLLALIVFSFVAPYLVHFVPTGSEVTAAPPTWIQTMAWLLELSVAYWLVTHLADLRSTFRQGFLTLLIAAALVSMFVVSRSLPPNQLTTPAAYFDLRPTIARLQALEDCQLLPAHCGRVWERLLSLSDIFFDPGDLPELAQIYGEQLTEESFLDYIVAVKQKEIVAPNLPMAFDLASVDGFDGGVLPLRNYTALLQLILPEGESANDGRLREYLDAIPEARWLDLFGARYVITDKVGDEWHDGVFFDTKHAQHVRPGRPVMVGDLPDYEATGVWLLGDAAGGILSITSEDGQLLRLQPERATDTVWRVTLPEPSIITNMALLATESAWQLHGLALVDSRDDTFQALVPGNYRLLYSGDVKIYENLDVLPRAFLVQRWRWRPDVKTALDVMAESTFDPRQEAVILGEGSDGAHEAEVAAEATLVSYEPDAITVQASVDTPTLLVLSESNYPGWQATLNGEPGELQQVDVLFRGVILPPGKHVVQFTFSSQSFMLGRWISAGAFIVWLLIFILLMASRRPARAN